MSSSQSASSSAAATTVLDVLRARGSDTPAALAYSVDGDGITYGRLLNDALRLAGVLAAHGLRRGDRCALILPSSLDFIRAVYAIQAAGAAPAAINAASPFDVMLRRIRLVDARVAIASSEIVAALHNKSGASACRFEESERLMAAARFSAPALALPRPKDPAFLQLTSGTVGEPRAAVISHRSLLASLTASRSRLAIGADDVLATWVPLHHDLGLVRFVFGALFFGCASHFVAPAIANMGRWLQTIARVRATVTGSPDFGYRLATRIVDPRGLDLTSLRFATNGGEPVRRSTIEDFERRFGLSGAVRPAYGLAEATLGVTSLGPGEPLRADADGTVSCGRPFDGIVLRIADEEGRDLPPGRAGEILVGGESLFDGYFADELTTREVLRGGWLHTGDVGAMDNNGHLYVKGRARALIKRAGATIAPREIEEIVDRIDGVRLSAAVGISAATVSGTEEIVIVVELRSAGPYSRATRLDLTARIEQAVIRAVGVSPGQVLLVAPRSIPRTLSGKTRYDALRRLVVAGHFDGNVDPDHVGV
jgi:acyl-CoA synthetase (AMP-forming)/AMP-acid ligase II